jgi:putative phosphoribosyl transferase
MTTWMTQERIDLGPVRLDGDLTLPEHATGIVLFAHGSGSSRRSPRNQQVAAELNRRGLATLLIDLDVPDIGLLADRLIGVIDWLRVQPPTAALPIGLFGASTGGGAALVAAADRPEAVHAVVSRGGRPDLAGPALLEVRAPTLLIVGGADTALVDLNEQARNTMRVRAELRIVPGATHLFPEPGALDTVADEAAHWFGSHLSAAMTR